jgi:hypothetical protein
MSDSRDDQVKLRVLPLRTQPDALDDYNIPPGNRWQCDALGFHWNARRCVERVVVLIDRPSGTIGYETAMCGSRTTVICLATRLDAHGNTTIGFVSSQRLFLPATLEARERWDAAISANRLEGELLGVEVLELPMGFSNPGMTVEESAYQEGCEELGVAVLRETVQELSIIYGDPYFAPEHCVVFRMIAGFGPSDHDPEDLEIVAGSLWLTESEIRQAIRDGRIRDARTLAALHLFALCTT